MISAVTPRRFPDSFVFGTAAAAFQIEGSPLADGAVPSNWYRFTHRRGKIDRGESADLACDHYHRYEADLDELAALGVGSYRLSTAWPRVVPAPGEVNGRGLDFYERIVDGLLRRGIDPLVTLFHWDLPGWLEDCGGFTVRESVDRLTEYAGAVYRRLGDRVKRWVTINEPMVFATKGYLIGDFPPGRRLDIRGYFRAAHHLLLGHARMVELGRSLVPGGEFGISEMQIRLMPARPGNRRDERAAGTMDAFLNRFFIDPIVHGSYPEEILAIARKRLPREFEGDLEEMHPPIDFIGLNYYFGQHYRRAWWRPIIPARATADRSAPKSAMWEVHPHGLYDRLLRLKEEYGDPRVLITENGYPLPEDDGPIIEDTERITYLGQHLSEVLKAIAAGVRCEGYYLWSFLDNFEWNLGYRMRFGLIRVDFGSLERTWRRSAHWYRELIERRSL